MLKMLTHFPSSSIAAVALLTLFTFATVSKSEEQTFSSALTGPRTNATGFAQLSLTPDTGDVIFSIAFSVEKPTTGLIFDSNFSFSFYANITCCGTAGAFTLPSSHEVKAFQDGKYKVSINSQQYPQGEIDGVIRASTNTLPSELSSDTQDASSSEGTGSSQSSRTKSESTDATQPQSESTLTQTDQRTTEVSSLAESTAQSQASSENASNSPSSRTSEESTEESRSKTIESQTERSQSQTGESQTGSSQSPTTESPNSLQNHTTESQTGGSNSQNTETKVSTASESNSEGTSILSTFQSFESDSSRNNTTDTSKSKGTPFGLIVGLVMVGLITVVVVGGGVWYCTARKKARSEPDWMDSDRESSQSLLPDRLDDI